MGGHHRHVEVQTYQVITFLQSRQVFSENQLQWKVSIDSILQEYKQISFDKRSGPTPLIYHEHTGETWVMPTVM